MSEASAPDSTDAACTLDGELSAQLAALEHDVSYRFVSTLKENEWERTEIVGDAAGNRFVRKYLKDDAEGFGRQYETIQQVVNPSLPRIFEVYRIPGSLVVIMQYLEGPTLREWIRVSGPVSESSACAIILDLCIGIEALHRLDPPLIHRDINPNNVVLAHDGMKLIDFGIARRFNASAQRDTRSWGTFGYAAPEQFGFGQSDPRTDIYALGMLYWFLITGTDPEPTLAKTIAAAPLSNSSKHIIATCIHLDADQRYASVEDLCKDLRAYAPLPPPTTPAITPPSPIIIPSVPTTPSPSTMKQRIHAACERLWPPLNGKPHLAHAFNIYRRIATVFFVLSIIIVFSSGFNSWRAEFTADSIHYALWASAYLFVLQLPLYLITTDFYGFLSHGWFLRNHRVLRIVVTFVVWFFIMVALSMLPDSLFSAEYLSAAASHGTRF